MFNNKKFDFELYANEENSASAIFLQKNIHFFTAPFRKSKQFHAWALLEEENAKIYKSIENQYQNYSKSMKSSKIIKETYHHAVKKFQPIAERYHVFAEFSEALKIALSSEKLYHKYLDALVKEWNNQDNIASDAQIMLKMLKGNAQLNNTIKRYHNNPLLQQAIHHWTLNHEKEEKIVQKVQKIDIEKKETVISQPFFSKPAPVKKPVKHWVKRLIKRPVKYKKMPEKGMIITQASIERLTITITVNDTLNDENKKELTTTHKPFNC